MRERERERLRKISSSGYRSTRRSVCSLYAMNEYAILSRNVNMRCGSILGLHARALG